MSLAAGTDDTDRGICLELEQIAAYLDGGVGEAEAAHIVRHVRACAGCAAVLLEAARCLVAPGDPQLARLEILCRHQTPP